MTPKQKREIAASLKQRNERLRAATQEAALAFWLDSDLPPPSSPDVPLAGLHKARIMWRDATAEEVRASRSWLIAHGFKAPERPMDYDATVNGENE